MDNEQQAPFASFQPSPDAPPVPPETPAKGSTSKKGKNRGTKPKKAVAGSAAEPAKPAGGARIKKPRKTKKIGASRAYKVDVGLALTALVGLSESDASLLETVADMLSDAPKKSRRRIAAALSKIFA